jgi:Hemerythrin HHE cation binding domain
MTTPFRLDMTMMLAVHDALRRDVDCVMQMTARSEGWDLFERYLRMHHEAEDDALWPVMEVPTELASRFKFARQKSTLAGTIRGSYFAFKNEY